MGEGIQEALRETFYQSFHRFLGRERKNILNGVAERNLCGCWAPLLESVAIERGFEGYRADPDYNRMQNGQVKVMLVGGLDVVSIVCDLILHSRGEIPERDNLIAIEMKKSHRPDAEKDSDRTRLMTLTRSSFDGIWSADGRTLPRYVCGYLLGYYCEIGLKEREILIEEYAEGELIDQRVVSF
jgi:hypothetical protein